MGHSHGPSHAPMAPQAAEEGDPWANWVGLSAEHAPLLREAATLARRAGRPHEGLEAPCPGLTESKELKRAPTPQLY